MWWQLTQLIVSKDTLTSVVLICDSALTSMISDSSWDQSTGLWPTQDCLFDDDGDGDGDDDDCCWSKDSRVNGETLLNWWLQFWIGIQCWKQRKCIHFQHCWSCYLISFHSKHCKHNVFWLVLIVFNHKTTELFQLYHGSWKEAKKTSQLFHVEAGIFLFHLNRV